MQVLRLKFHETWPIGLEAWCLFCTESIICQWLLSRLREFCSTSSVWINDLFILCSLTHFRQCGLSFRPCGSQITRLEIWEGYLLKLALLYHCKILIPFPTMICLFQQMRRGEIWGWGQHDLHNLHSSRNKGPK